MTRVLSSRASTARGRPRPHRSEVDIAPHILGYVAAIAAASLLGAALVAFTPLRRGRALRVAVAFGAGFLVAVVLGGMLPHALEAELAAVWIIAGYLAVFLAEKAFGPRGHHEGEHDHDHGHHDAHHDPDDPSRVIGRWAAPAVLVGLALHAFFDGVALASGFGVDAAVGVLVATGILLHKAPEGATVASVLLAAGVGRGRALLAVAALAGATLLGAALIGFAGRFAEQGLALGAGVTVYVAASHLVPEVRAHGGWPSVAALTVGMGIFFLATALLGGVH